MPYRRVRRIRRRRYAVVRKKVMRMVSGGLARIPRVATRRTHVFKRLAQEITLTNDPNTNQPLWSSNNCLSVPVVLSDDFGTWQTGLGMNFNLNEVQQVTDFTALFDRYKIVGVKLKFLFQNNQGGYPGGTRAPLPLITYAYDADDQTSPTAKSLVQVKQYAKERVLNGNTSFSLYYKPRVARMVFQGLTSTSYESAKAPWLDCSNPSVPHYGLKLWINNWFSDHQTSSFKLTISPTYYIAMKDTQ